ncbi:ROK family transcriptional regulator [Nocardioides nitrophenolicus]|uniref:ROK family transcriptional regulator n=1 Tax=Nocardioides nitrophenolicus TaxID=60489 RepID=UPI00195D9F05|nr:ROK family transcriptional regulator [Nocardioides nitrophenolicus]MBM7516195.1 putative NBD/HSP70 family sugar kinase [Nocardioides nitrophenolicus]
MSWRSPTSRSPRERIKLDRADSRRHHRSMLLQELFAAGPASRADLARSSGLTRVTVSDLVAELLAEGLVEELGTPSESRVGKPPTLVGLVADAKHVVAIDLSVDDQLAGAVLTLEGQVVLRDAKPREGRTGAAAVALVREFAADLIDRSSRPLLGVAVATPGVVTPDGVVLDAPNLGWHDLRLADDLAAALDLPVYVANDANTAVMGEFVFGSRGEGGLLLLRLSTGLGAGLVINGALLHGQGGAAGEIGHVQVDPDGPLCGCGRPGCLETYLAVPRLRRELAVGDPDAVLADAGARLGQALAPVVATLNLGEVVLSGPADLVEPLARVAEQEVRDRVMPVSAQQFVVRTSSLGDDGVLAGATGVVLAGELGVS